MIYLASNSHFRKIENMNRCNFAIILLFLSGLLAVPVVDQNDSNEGLVREARSPTFHKKHGHGGLLFGGGPSLGGGGNNYVTNINNFGPHEPAHHGHEPAHHGHVPVGGAFAGSSASAGGGQGHSSAQSQSASFSVGPFAASFSQSQAQSGEKRGGGIFDYFDY